MRFVARCGLGPPFWTLRPSILGAFGAQAAVATAGESPKFSFFGIAGNANTRAPSAGIERTPQKKTNPGEGARGHGRGGGAGRTLVRERTAAPSSGGWKRSRSPRRYSEGGAYGIDQKAELYSPYSVYGPRDGADVVYKRGNAEEVKFKKAMFTENSKRVAKTKTYIEKKSWEDVRSELIRQAYNMRNTMNYLAANSGKPEAKAAAKEFYQNLEQVNLLSKRKKQDAALAAYDDMMASLDKFSKLI